MIHPALYKLIRLQGRSIVRRMMRGGFSPARVLVFAIGAILCIGFLAAPILSNKARTDPHRVRVVMPLALLGMCVITAITSVGDKAIAFTPGEVDQLFPGPFTRRELLAYKLIKSTLAAVLTAVILSIVMLRHARWWPGSFAGVFFSLLFVQFFSIALLLMGQSLGAAAYTKFRKIVIVGAAVLIMLGARTWIAAGVNGGEAALYAFSASPIGEFVLAPFQPFGQMMTSAGVLDLLKWAALAALLNAGLLLLVFLLDAKYLETAMAASERRYAKIQRVRAGAFLSLGVSKTSQWHLPQLPWAGGAGPIVWRQLTNAARSSRGLLLLLLIVAVGAAPVLSVAGQGGKFREFMLGVLGWMTFLCSNMLSFDFRGDVDHMEGLKALPLNSSAVTAGQLVTPVLVLSMFHFLLLGSAALVVPMHRQWLLIAMPLVLPFNAILFGAENLIFLLFPSRPAAVSPGDFQVLGRKFVFFIGKILILAALCMVALFPSVLVWVFTGKNLAAATAVGWIILAGEAVALVPVIAWAYRRFDPSIHTPA
jgi:hypothetical protein